jgi:transmembrane sensor
VVSAAAKPEEIAAEREAAAAWVVRLQPSGRSPATEAAFREWIAGSPARRAAFAETTEVWQELGGVGAAFLRRRATQRRNRRLAMAAVTACAAALAAAVFLPHAFDPLYETPVGGRRTIRLADGSMVTLNTDTRIRVHYSKRRRDLRLERGEALFEVAKNPNRPFVVRDGKSEVRALGTVFTVREVGKGAGVTLLEGRVMIGPEPQLFRPQAPARPVVLYPGQMWRRQDQEVLKLSRTALDAATAWKIGRVVMDNLPLAEAAAELNRYASPPIEIETENAARLPISGVFDAHDGRGFSRTVAAIYGLTVREEDGRLLLAGAPRAD